MKPEVYSFDILKDNTVTLFICSVSNMLVDRWENNSPTERTTVL